MPYARIAGDYVAVGQGHERHRRFRRHNTVVGGNDSDRRYRRRWVIPAGRRSANRRRLAYCYRTSRRGIPARRVRSAARRHLASLRAQRNRGRGRTIDPSSRRFGTRKPSSGSSVQNSIWRKSVGSSPKRSSCGSKASAIVDIARAPMASTAWKSQAWPKGRDPTRCSDGAARAPMLNHPCSNQQAVSSFVRFSIA